MSLPHNHYSKKTAVLKQEMTFFLYFHYICINQISNTVSPRCGPFFLYYMVNIRLILKRVGLIYKKETRTIQSFSKTKRKSSKQKEIVVYYRFPEKNQELKK